MSLASIGAATDVRGVAQAAPRIIGYVRVSTEEQADSGLGLAAQRARLEAACVFKGWELVDVVADEGVSGTSIAKRKGLRGALRRIARREADGLVVAKLDRLSRSSVDTALIFEWFKTCDATLCVLDVDVDTTSPIGQAVVSIMAAIAQLERDNTADRTRQALAVKRARGERVGRPGVHEDSALTRRIRRMREDGLSLQAIADKLNAEGVPTIRGGQKWRPSSIQSAAGYARPPRRKAKTSLPAAPRGRR